MPTPAPTAKPVLLPEVHPAAGGSYTRKPDGSLVPNTTPAPKE
jgi:hypothetical protein